MAAVYSTRFIATTAGGVQVNFIVPPMKRAVVRGIYGVSFGAVGGTVYVNCGAWNVWFLRIQEVPQRLAGDIRAVAYAGEAIGCFIDATSVSIVVSGYLFDDPIGAALDGQDGQEDPAYPPPPGPAFAS
jgi:hypothetical protein